ncbi:MAG: hypothetical protein ACHP8A_09730 [Terriglobales bacterium]|jgi:hypothetical protein
MRISREHYFSRLHALLGALILVLWISPLQAREKAKKGDYGTGLSVEIESPESEVLQAVEDVADDGIIQGTREYNKDENISGASSVASTPLYPPWTGPGKVFYKARTEALDPRNFKEGGDVGTLAVRYIVQSAGPAKTNLRIDAVFVEDFRRTVHLSNGMVESSEYKDITDHLDQMHLREKETDEAAKKREQDVAQSELRRAPTDDNGASRLAAAQVSTHTLEQHVQDLRRHVERRVAASGAALKSAPFHTASTLKPLTPGTEVVILIVTPYWYGVETQDGQHGWLFHDQVEALP